MQRVVFRHTKGSRNSRVDEFPLHGFKPLTVGRDPLSGLKYDPEQDDLVGRQHARIEQHPSDPFQFTIVDLGSRNGTFVNRQRITASAVLQPGDVLQFGAGGPEVVFDLDPPPPHLVKHTRLAGADSAADLAPTRIETAKPVATAVARQKSGVGAATVERMVVQAEQRATVKMGRWLGAVAIMAALAIGVARFGQLKPAPAPSAPVPDGRLTPEQIAAANAEATVYIEAGWKLIEASSGKQLFQEAVGQKTKDGVVYIPVYLRLPNGSVEPALTVDPGAQGQNMPIGSRHRGSGFVVSGDGFILTNRHVAAAWETAYTNLRPGVVVDLSTGKGAVLQQPPSDWVPANTKLLGRKLLGAENIVGRNDYLNVVLARTRSRMSGRLVRPSDRHDVALVKVDTPAPLKKVDIFDNYESASAGAAVTVMGYPGISPEVVAETQSGDAFNPESRVQSVPDPTVTPGTIGRVLRAGGQGAGPSKENIYSAFGDVYQLTVNATGGGNSGGPMFDDRGRVIGIYTSGRSMPGDAAVSFAVPIRYGLELMQVSPVLK